MPTSPRRMAPCCQSELCACETRQMTPSFLPVSSAYSSCTIATNGFWPVSALQGCGVGHSVPQVQFFPGKWESLTAEAAGHWMQHLRGLSQLGCSPVLLMHVRDTLLSFPSVRKRVRTGHTPSSSLSPRFRTYARRRAAWTRAAPQSRFGLGGFAAGGAARGGSPPSRRLCHSHRHRERGRGYLLYVSSGPQVLSSALAPHPLRGCQSTLGGALKPTLGKGS